MHSVDNNYSINVGNCTAKRVFLTHCLVMAPMFSALYNPRAQNIKALIVSQLQNCLHVNKETNLYF